MYRCRLCRHKATASHDMCRTHAHCARGGQYWGAYCPICRDLWKRVRDVLNDPVDALEAWETLSKWVEGFVKNTRHRIRGQPIFANRNERFEYMDTAILMKNIAAIPELDSASQISSSIAVSVCRELPFCNFLSVLNVLYDIYRI